MSYIHNGCTTTLYSNDFCDKNDGKEIQNEKMHNNKFKKVIDNMSNQLAWYGNLYCFSQQLVIIGNWLEATSYQKQALCSCHYFW